mgnify:FL=1
MPCLNKECCCRGSLLAHVLNSSFTLQRLLKEPDFTLFSPHSSAMKREDHFARTLSDPFSPVKTKLKEALSRNRYYKIMSAAPALFFIFFHLMQPFAPQRNLIFRKHCQKRLLCYHYLIYLHKTMKLPGPASAPFRSRAGIARSLVRKPSTFKYKQAPAAPQQQVPVLFMPEKSLVALCLQ